VQRRPSSARESCCALVRARWSSSLRAAHLCPSPTVHVWFIARVRVLRRQDVMSVIGERTHANSQTFARLSVLWHDFVEHHSAIHNLKIRRDAGACTQAVLVEAAALAVRRVVVALCVQAPRRRLASSTRRCPRRWDTAASSSRSCLRMPRRSKVWRCADAGAGASRTCAGGLTYS
jgi:hypothetical protein